MEDDGDDLEVRLTWLSDGTEESADDNRPNLPRHNPPAVSAAGAPPGFVKLAEAVARIERETAALRSMLRERLDVLPDIATNSRETIGLLDEVGAVATIHAGAHATLAAAVDDLAQRTARTERDLTLLIDEVVALATLLAASRVGPSERRTADPRGARATPRAPAKSSSSVRASQRTTKAAPGPSGKAKPAAPAKRAPMPPGKTTVLASTKSTPSVRASAGARKAAPHPSGKANRPDQDGAPEAAASVRQSSSSSDSGTLRKAQSSRPLVGGAPA